MSNRVINHAKPNDSSSTTLAESLLDAPKTTQIVHDQDELNHAIRAMLLAPQSGCVRFELQQAGKEATFDLQVIYSEVSGEKRIAYRDSMGRPLQNASILTVLASLGFDHHHIDDLNSAARKQRAIAGAITSQPSVVASPVTFFHTTTIPVSQDHLEHKNILSNK